jgi:hypothetical protein
MNNQQLNESFSQLSTPLIADACLRLNIPLRLAPAGIRPLRMEAHIAGRALPVRHYGSVDIFLETMGSGVLVNPGYSSRMAFSSRRQLFVAVWTFKYIINTVSHLF